jgi:predicted nuclease of predicted toxin-antitoxin system
LSLRFLIDAQLPPALVEIFESKGHQAVHVADVGLLTARDAAIRAYAAKAQMVLVTKDEDFVATRRLGGHGPQVVWIRMGNTSNRALSTRRRPVIDQVVAALTGGDAIVEVR